MKTKKDVDSAVGLEVTSANGRGSQPAQYRENASTIIKRVAAEKEKRVQLIELSMEEETQSGDREFAVGVIKRWIREAIAYSSSGGIAAQSPTR